MRFKIVLCLLKVVFLLSLFTQQIAAQEDAWYIGNVIRDIKITGLKEINVKTLRPILAQFIGKKFTEKIFFLLQSRLYALDYFEQIIPRAVRYQGGEDGVVILISVKERPTIKHIILKGNKKIAGAKIRSVIILKNGSFYSDSAAKSDRLAILSLYTNKGFSDAKVVFDFNLEQRELTFTVIEGYERRIKSILFYGNESYSDRKLRRVIKSKATGILSKGEFSQSRLEEDQDLLLQFYHEHGYMDILIFDRKIETNRNSEKKREDLTVSYFLEEGAQFLFGQVTVEGNVLFPDEELLKFFIQKKGDTFNSLYFKRGLQNLQEVYLQNGYVFNDFSVNEKRNGAYIDYHITITEKDRAHVENITVSGNKKAKKYIIKRELSLEPGDIYQVSALRNAYFALASLQYFSSVDITTPPGSAEGLVDVNIAVEDANTTNLRFGMSFGASDEFPISAVIGWTDRNFLGRGLNLSISSNISHIEQSVQLSLSSSWLFGLRWSSGLSFFFKHSKLSTVNDDSQAPYGVDDPYISEYVFSRNTTYNGQRYAAGDAFPGYPSQQDITSYNLLLDHEYAEKSSNLETLYMEYESYSLGVSYNTNYRFLTPIGVISPSASIGIYFDHVKYDSLLYRPANQQTRKNLNRWLPVTRFSLGIVFDYRDIRFSPTKGYLLSQNLAFYGGIFFGSRHFIRSDTSLSVYIPLVNMPVSENWSWKLVLAMESSFSILFNQFYYPNGTTYQKDGPAENDLLVLDGIFSARGWPLQRGGEAVWNSWAELRMPLAEKMVWFDMYFEIAHLWKNRKDVTYLSIQDFKFSIGAGLRFVLPQFPIRLYFGKRFKLDENGKAIWQRGNIFRPGDSEMGGADFIFSISLDVL